MLENSIYSILSPEGYSSILWKESGRAKEAAEVMKLTAEDLLSLEVIDKMIEEPNEGAHTNVKKMSQSMKEEIIQTEKELSKLKTEDLLAKRYEKIRNYGTKFVC